MWSSKPVRAALALIGLVAMVLPGSGRAASTLRVEVLSNRADLISGGDALVEIRFPAGGVDPKFAKIALNGTLINGSFALRAHGK